MNIRELAERALEEIRRTDPVNVFAVGRNTVMAARHVAPGYYHAFRRVCFEGVWRIRFEVWANQPSRGDSVETSWLPPDLEERAAKLLATMPAIRPLTPEEIASMEEAARRFGRPISS